MARTCWPTEAPIPARSEPTRRGLLPAWGAALPGRCVRRARACLRGFGWARARLPAPTTGRRAGLLATCSGGARALVLRLVAACSLWAGAALAEPAPTMPASLMPMAVPGAAANAPAAAPLNLRVVGGLADIAQFTRQEEPFWSQDLARLSGGRYSAHVVPFDRAGVPGADMLLLMKLGVVPFGTVLMSSLAAQFPQYTAPDLAGLNPDIHSLRVSLAAFRPYLEAALREEQRIETLAIYIYPAQMLFCRQPLERLDDLKGRRVRVSSAVQADFVSALGASAVHTAFAQIVPRFASGGLDCAITGTMSGNTLQLYRHATHLYAFPINWGMAIFGANRSAWEALPEDLRSLLRSELPRLEARIWTESERNTAEGIACNAGLPSCTSGHHGAMHIVNAAPGDWQLAQGILTQQVLPRWRQRCGPPCDTLWARTIGPARGLVARQP